MTGTAESIRIAPKLPSLFDAPPPEPRPEPAKPASSWRDAVRIEVIAVDAPPQRAPMRDVVFEPYQPQRIRIDGAQPHPTALVESAAMASVLPPIPTYCPMLARRIVDEGLLSIAQLEAVVYAGQAHSEFLEPQVVKVKNPAPPTITETMHVGLRLRRWLSNGWLIDEALDPRVRTNGKTFAIFCQKPGGKFDSPEGWNTVSTHDTLEEAMRSLQTTDSTVRMRKGYFVGDAPGAGKGRIICGLIMDSFARGQTKAIWVSKTGRLVKDAIRDWTDLGGDAADIFPLAKVAASATIAATHGILFCTYGLLRSASKATADSEGKSRLKQIVDWIGEDFSGVCAFDEAHCARNGLE